MISVAERLREYFDDHGVAYRVIEHEPAGSADEYHAVLGTRYEQMAKAVFLRCRNQDGKARTPVRLLRLVRAVNCEPRRLTESSCALYDNLHRIARR